MNSIRDTYADEYPERYPIRAIAPAEYPFLLRQVERLPKHLFIRGELPPDSHVWLTVVGSRRHTDYGKDSCEALVAALKGLPVVIVSGLAHGIDSIAHETALKNGLKTVAVPGSSVADGEIYPPSHHNLAHRILEAGGALLTPFEKTVMGNNWTFPFRNRIMAALAHATLVIEAQADSGTLITARHACEFSRGVLVVPGSIFSSRSAGTHEYLKDGATPIISGEDLVRELGFEPVRAMELKKSDAVARLTPIEREIVRLATDPIGRDALIGKLGIDAAAANTTISSLELKGAIEISPDGSINAR